MVIFNRSDDTEEWSQELKWGTEHSGHNEWERVRLTVSSSDIGSVRYQYRFAYEAILDYVEYQGMVEGDLAIDDIVFSSGCK